MKKILLIFFTTIMVVFAAGFVINFGLSSVAAGPDLPAAPPKADSTAPKLPKLPALKEGEGRTLEELGKFPGMKLPPNLPKFGISAEKNPVKATESFFLNYIISPIFLLAAGVAVIMILYASFQIITARGEEEGITKAKTTLIWAAAGLALIMLAYTLVRNISTIITDLEKSGSSPPAAAPPAPPRR